MFLLALLRPDYSIHEDVSPVGLALRAERGRVVLDHDPLSAPGAPAFSDTDAGHPDRPDASKLGPGAGQHRLVREVELGAALPTFAVLRHIRPRRRCRSTRAPTCGPPAT